MVIPDVLIPDDDDFNSMLSNSFGNIFSIHPPVQCCSISSSIIVAMPRLDLIHANFSRGIFLCEGSIEKYRRLDVRGLRVEIMFERREREGGTSVSPHSHGSAVCFQPTIYALARALIELCNYGVARL